MSPNFQKAIVTFTVNVVAHSVICSFFLQYSLFHYFHTKGFSQWWLSLFMTAFNLLLLPISGLSYTCSLTWTFSIEIIAWKVFVFVVLLVRIFPHSDEIRARNTANTDTFHSVNNNFFIHLCKNYIYFSIYCHFLIGLYYFAMPNPTTVLEKVVHLGNYTLQTY